MPTEPARRADIAAVHPPGRPGEAARLVRTEPGGPILVEGPVEVVLEDGSTQVYGRFAVALCGCRRSHRYPLCDTSHRCRVRTHDGTTPPGSAG